MNFLFKQPYFYSVPLISLLLVVAITYFRVPQLFFSQDEWLGFGSMIGYGMEFVISKNLMGVSHFVPLTLLIDYSIFKVFGLNYMVYNTLALIFHFLNGFLIFLIFKDLISRNQQLSFTYKRVLPLIAAVLFITSSTGYQLVMWTVININTLSLTFSLLALFIIFKYYDSDKEMSLSVKIALSVFVLLALLVVEYSVTLVLFLPLSFMISKNPKEAIIKLFKTLWPFLIMLVFYFAFRLPTILSVQKINTDVQEVGIVSIEFFRLIKFPLRYLGQLVFPEDLILWVSRIFESDPALGEGSMFKLIAFVLGGIVISSVFLLIVCSYRKFVMESKTLLLILLFIVCTSLTFIFIPGQSNSFTIFPSRYLYFGLAGYALLLTYMLSMAVSHRVRILVNILFLLIIFTIGFGVYDNWVKSELLRKESIQRLQILNTIKNSYPTLPKKTVFYIHSDTSYYGLPVTERILPFQSGFGQTLLVWYNDQMHFPNEFFRNKFLWKITEQGYKEEDGFGFGYYRDFDSLVKLVIEKRIELNSIIAYSFNSKTGNLTDTSNETKGAVIGYQAKKRSVAQSLYLVTPLTNFKNIDLVKDGNRMTFWDSKSVSINPQYLIVDLGANKKISQLSIDSYDNKNQDKVGYEISLSVNGIDFQKVFALKLYPPDETGIVNIYFKPQEARFVKIYQEGQHRYASWVINEFTIFEAI